MSASAISFHLARTGWLLSSKNDSRRTLTPVRARHSRRAFAWLAGDVASRFCIRSHREKSPRSRELMLPGERMTTRTGRSEREQCSLRQMQEQSFSRFFLTARRSGRRCGEASGGRAAQVKDDRFAWSWRLWAPAWCTIMLGKWQLPVYGNQVYITMSIRQELGKFESSNWIGTKTVWSRERRYFPKTADLKIPHIVSSQLVISSTPHVAFFSESQTALRYTIVFRPQLCPGPLLGAFAQPPVPDSQWLTLQ